MDKKILLSGGGALLLVGNMYATPANAAIDLSIGGEASVTFSMSDECADAGTSLGDGVDLSMQFSTNDYDYGGAASEQNYYADFKITVGF